VGPFSPEALTLRHDVMSLGSGERDWPAIFSEHKLEWSQSFLIIPLISAWQLFHHRVRPKRATFTVTFSACNHISPKLKGKDKDTSP
jgi:hypothetical protein